MRMNIIIKEGKINQKSNKINYIISNERAENFIRKITMLKTARKEEKILGDYQVGDYSDNKGILLFTTLIPKNYVKSNQIYSKSSIRTFPKSRKLAFFEVGFYYDYSNQGE